MTTGSDLAPDDADTADSTWIVLVNGEGQHSLWPVTQMVPPGWSEVGPEGTQAQCLAYINTHWTDMRPRSLR